MTERNAAMTLLRMENTCFRSNSVVTQRDGIIRACRARTFLWHAGCINYQQSSTACIRK